MHFGFPFSSQCNKDILLMCGRIVKLVGHIGRQIKKFCRKLQHGTCGWQAVDSSQWCHFKEGPSLNCFGVGVPHCKVTSLLLIKPKFNFVELSNLVVCMCVGTTSISHLPHALTKCREPFFNKLLMSFLTMQHFGEVGPYMAHLS